MPMLAIFGAEVIGAEVLAAEAAAAAAAEAAAIEAAQVAAAEAAAQEAARQAATQQAAQAVTNSGITGIPDPSQLAAKGSFNPSTGQFINTTLPPDPVFQNIGGQGVTTPQTFPVTDGGITSVPQAAPSVAPPAASPISNTSPMGLEMPGAYTPSNYPMGYEGQIPANQFIEPGSAGMPSMENTIAQANIPVTPPSGLEAGFDKAIKFAEKNPFTAMTLAYTGANALGLMNPSGATFNQEKYNGPLSKYKLSPNFQGRTANPADFQYRGYAGGGGIMGANAYDIPVGYAKGGKTDDPATVPMGSNRLSPIDQASNIKLDTGLLSGDVTLDNYGQPLALGTSLASLQTGARNALTTDSNVGRYAVPGLGDLGQFAGSFDASNVPMGNNSYSPVDQAKMIARDIAIMEGTAPVMPRDKSGTIANLRGDSDAGRYGVPGYGDLGQFAGSGGGGGAKPYDDFSSQAYAKGGSLSDSIAQYQKMLGGQQQAAPARSADVGIYYDQDPDTRYQDALTAAQIRQAKVNQRAYVSPPAAKRPTPLGKLNMPTSAKSKESSSGDVEAYEGGIMSSSLGGYAAGGNPRLLKGPGDGMSDNIPATINGRQPARLADGEFVIPADVVSHLGNGSTEAGAKHLHAMMNKVRKARTGNPKQGKQINPRKYMPK